MATGYCSSRTLTGGSWEPLTAVTRQGGQDPRAVCRWGRGSGLTRGRLGASSLSPAPDPGSNFRAKTQQDHGSRWQGPASGRATHRTSAPPAAALTGSRVSVHHPLGPLCPCSRQGDPAQGGTQCWEEEPGATTRPRRAHGQTEGPPGLPACAGTTVPSNLTSEPAERGLSQSFSVRLARIAETCFEKLVGLPPLHGSGPKGPRRWGRCQEPARSGSARRCP